MKTCNDVRPHLKSLADGEASPPLEKLLRTHLDGCEQCAGEYYEINQLTRTISGVDWESPAPRLRSRILAAIDETPAPLRRSPWAFLLGPNRWILAGGTVAALLLVVFTVYQPGGIGKPDSLRVASAGSSAPNESVNGDTSGFSKEAAPRSEMAAMMDRGGEERKSKTEQSPGAPVAFGIAGGSKVSTDHNRAQSIASTRGVEDSTRSKRIAPVEAKILAPAILDKKVDRLPAALASSLQSKAAPTSAEAAGGRGAASAANQPASPALQQQAASQSLYDLSLLPRSPIVIASNRIEFDTSAAVRAIKDLGGTVEDSKSTLMAGGMRQNTLYFAIPLKEPDVVVNRLLQLESEQVRPQGLEYRAMMRSELDQQSFGRNNSAFQYSQKGGSLGGFGGGGAGAGRGGLQELKHQNPPAAGSALGGSLGASTAGPTGQAGFGADVYKKNSQSEPKQDRISNSKTSAGSQFTPGKPSDETAAKARRAASEQRDDLSKAKDTADKSLSKNVASSKARGAVTHLKEELGKMGLQRSQSLPANAIAGEQQEAQSRSRSARFLDTAANPTLPRVVYFRLEIREAKPGKPQDE